MLESRSFGEVDGDDRILAMRGRFTQDCAGRWIREFRERDCAPQNQQSRGSAHTSFVGQMTASRTINPLTCRFDIERAPDVRFRRRALALLPDAGIRTETLRKGLGFRFRLRLCRVNPFLETRGLHDFLRRAQRGERQ